ncbi:MAG: hypothetical protein C5B50_12410 [Verrucomicrobia bacterium]|nr:MAG: hypothetical protein C5B50_12410 [Verrucomicrobiota bacterium]
MEKGPESRVGPKSILLRKFAVGRPKEPFLRGVGGVVGQSCLLGHFNGFDVRRGPTVAAIGPDEGSPKSVRRRLSSAREVAQSPKSRRGSWKTDHKRGARERSFVGGMLFISHFGENGHQS